MTAGGAGPAGKLRAVAGTVDRTRNVPLVPLFGHFRKSAHAAAHVIDPFHFFGLRRLRRVVVTSGGRVDAHFGLVVLEGHPLISLAGQQIVLARVHRAEGHALRLQGDEKKLVGCPVLPEGVRHHHFLLFVKVSTKIKLYVFPDDQIVLSSQNVPGNDVTKHNPIILLVRPHQLAIGLRPVEGSQQGRLSFLFEVKGLFPILDLVFPALRGLGLLFFYVALGGKVAAGGCRLERSKLAC